MYASDVINRNRANTLYINSVLKTKEFTSGKSIRIDRQRGGIDYQYLTNVEFGNIIDYTYDVYIPLPVTSGPNTRIFSVVNMESTNIGAVDASGTFILYEYGTIPRDTSNNILTFNGLRVIDDASINIPMTSDFYFFRTNYGAANNIFWNTNNALTFGLLSSPSIVSLSAGSVPAILIGNYDRLCSGFYTNSYIAQGNFAITAIIVYFSNYYTDKSNFDAGKYQIRMIRELTGDNRQWVEVTVISAVSSPGYSNNPSVTYPSGRDASGNNIDANAFVIDPTKNSPYDITDGTAFLNVAGSRYSTVSPQTGTSFMYQSNKYGEAWIFIDNAYLPV